MADQQNDRNAGNTGSPRREPAEARPTPAGTSEERPRGASAPDADRERQRRSIEGRRKNLLRQREDLNRRLGEHDEAIKRLEKDIADLSQ